MTPDMKRLCDAVWAAEATQAFRAATGEQSSADATSHERRRYEAIVRAVLVALKDPSVEACILGGGTECAAPSSSGPLHENEGYPIGAIAAERAFTAMIDHILDTNARRAAALQDLADIDRDLL